MAAISTHLRSHRHHRRGGQVPGPCDRSLVLRPLTALVPVGLGLLIACYCQPDQPADHQRGNDAPGHADALAYRILNGPDDWRAARDVPRAEPNRFTQRTHFAWTPAHVRAVRRGAYRKFRYRLSRCALVVVPRTIYSPEHQRLVILLRHYRERAGLRQVDLAKVLDRPQSFVSDYERGQRRLDLVELDTICSAVGISVVTLVRRWSEEGHRS